jgi:hypothetical protein
LSQKDVKVWTVITESKSEEVEYGEEKRCVDFREQRLELMTTFNLE